MEPIELGYDLYLKKLDSNNSKDIWLAEKLDEDPLIVGEQGYLYSIKEALGKSEYYLTRADYYDSHYALYKCSNPIGYMGISSFESTLKSVNLAYAILLSERKKGYATKALKAISDILLEEDIKKITLDIHPHNTPSIIVAASAGFTSDGLSDAEHEIQEYIHYEKTKTIFDRKWHIR